MSLTLRLTIQMTADEMWPLWPDIIGCLERYCARFPDETVEGVISQCAAGRRQLWVVIDENGSVILTPITEIVKIDATGEFRLLLAQVGGKRLRECMPLLAEIEKWAAREYGAKESELIGRGRRGSSGWTRHLEPLGYEPVAVVYRKEIAA